MEDAFSFGPFRLHPGRRILRKDGTIVSLGSRSFDMLVAMVDQNGKILTPEDLMAIAWPGLIVEESNVRVQVANLRRPLGSHRDVRASSKTLRDVGYCSVAPVTRIESVDHPLAATSEPTLPTPSKGQGLTSSRNDHTGIKLRSRDRGHRVGGP